MDVVLCNPVRTPVVRGNGYASGVAAHDAEHFAEELIPVTVPGRRGKPDTIVTMGLGPVAATAAYEARRRDARFVPETMCIGGGQGIAAIFEVIR